MPGQRRPKKELDIDVTLDEMRQTSENLLEYARTRFIRDVDTKTCFLDDTIIDAVKRYKARRLSIPLLAEHLDVSRQTIYAWIMTPKPDPNSRTQPDPPKAKIKTLEKLAFDLNKCFKVGIRRDGGGLRVGRFEGYLYDEQQIQREFLYFKNPELRFRSELNNTDWDAQDPKFIMWAFDHIETIDQYDEEVVEIAREYRKYKYQVLKVFLNNRSEKWIEKIPAVVRHLPEFNSHKELKQLIKNPNCGLTPSQVLLVEASLEKETNLIIKLAKEYATQNFNPDVISKHNTIPIVDVRTINFGGSLTEMIQSSNLHLKVDSHNPAFIGIPVRDSAYEPKYDAGDILLCETGVMPEDDMKVIAKVNGEVVVGLFCYGGAVSYISRWQSVTNLPDVTIVVADDDKHPEVKRNIDWIFTIRDVIKRADLPF